MPRIPGNSQPPAGARLLQCGFATGTATARSQASADATAAQQAPDRTERRAMTAVPAPGLAGAPAWMMADCRQRDATRRQRVPNSFGPDAVSAVQATVVPAGR